MCFLFFCFLQVTHCYVNCLCEGILYPSDLVFCEGRRNLARGLAVVRAEKQRRGLYAKAPRDLQNQVKRRLCHAALDIADCSVRDIAHLRKPSLRDSASVAVEFHVLDEALLIIDHGSLKIAVFAMTSGETVFFEQIRDVPNERVTEFLIPFLNRHVRVNCDFCCVQKKQVGGNVKRICEQLYHVNRRKLLSRLNLAQIIGRYITLFRKLLLANLGFFSVKLNVINKYLSQ